MSTLQQEQVTSEQVELFAGQVAEELSAAYGTALAVLGDRLGLYRALAEAGPATSSELAARSGCAERYVREWLGSQVAGGWVTVDGDSGRFALPPAHVPVLVEPSPAFLLGSAQMAAALFTGLDRLAAAFRSGEGIAWGAQHPDLHEGGARFFRTAAEPYLSDWVEALEGVAELLRGGGRLVELGCGRGSGALALAHAFPQAAVLGVDVHAASVEHARAAAAAAGLAERVRFTTAAAQEWHDSGVHLVCLLDCLHDMGNPVAVAQRAAEALAPGGAVLVVEPMAGDRVEDNVNPVSRAYYAGSTGFCTANALAQEGGWALGAQAGEARLREVLEQGGLTRVRRVAATPFQLVLEARR